MAIPLIFMNNIKCLFPPQQQQGKHTGLSSQKGERKKTNEMEETKFIAENV